MRKEEGRTSVMKEEGTRRKGGLSKALMDMSCASLYSTVVHATLQSCTPASSDGTVVHATLLYLTLYSSRML